MVTRRGEAEGQQETIAALKGFTPKGFQCDGIFGPATEAVTKAIQQKAGLAVDGIAGPLTLKWLGDYKVPAQLVVPQPKPPAAPIAPVPAKPVPEPFKTVSAKPGDTGPMVATIQNALNVATKAKLTVNGVYDAATTAAVKNLQNFVKVPATGIVDGNTMATLMYFLSLKG